MPYDSRLWEIFSLSSSCFLDIVYAISFRLLDFIAEILTLLRLASLLVSVVKQNSDYLNT